MSRFFDAVPYILAVCAILLGAFEIVKDWKEYKTSWLRMAVAAVFMVVAVLTIASLRHDNQVKRDEKAKSDGDMKALQAKADASNLAQTENTKLYVESFTKMSGQLGDLKTEVRTEALQKKLDAVQAQLQKSLEPAPKAELIFSFVPFYNPPAPGTPVATKEVTVAPNADGSIHVSFTVVNLTKVDAVDVTLNLRICSLCRYAKELAGFTKVPETDEGMRVIKIPAIHALEKLETFSLDVIPPPGFPDIQVGFSYRCRTCVLKVDIMPETVGTIHIRRP